MFKTTRYLQILWFCLSEVAGVKFFRCFSTIQGTLCLNHTDAFSSAVLVVLCAEAAMYARSELQ